MPLECVSVDPFTEATHLELDTIVNDALAPRSSVVPLLNYADLLSAIIEHSNDRLDTKYLGLTKADKLISANKDLWHMLASAWERRSYHDIRNLAILHPPSSVSSPSLPGALEPRGVVLTDRIRDELLFALTRPYQGVAVDAFYEYLEQNNRSFSDKTRAGYYARFCSIVQSSGTGKTRIMIELARKGVLVLYINLRPTKDATGFPLRDDVPASILVDGGASAEEYHVQCCAFFATVFKLIADDLSNRLGSGDKDAVGNWNDEMCQLTSPSRAEFFSRLKETYDQIMKELHGKGDVDEATVGVQALSLKDTGKTSGGKRVPSSVAEGRMQGQYMQLTKLFAEAFPGVGANQPKLVIALDEAHPLHETKDFRRASVLFRVIKIYSEFSPITYAVWVVFASTTSKVAHFASPQAFFDSARVSVGGELLFSPFSELGWDHYAPPLCTIPASEVGKAKHILRYGRPLWASLTGVMTLEQIFNFAMEKLTGALQSGQTDSPRQLAFIAQRFGLEVCFGHREAVQYVEMSVASQCRVCITTTEDRLWSYTTYPSEPFLSCAAAHLLHGALENTLKTLVARVDNGMIDIGQRGELVSRLLWLLAKDLFVLRNMNPSMTFADGNDFEAELIHCKMVSVIDFLEFVFGEGFWSKAGDDAKEAFQDAYINFSHWISMDADIRQEETLNKKPVQVDLDEWTSRHWQRTSAVQCCHNQPSIDKVIPIYFKSAQSASTCMSQIFISDKGRTAKQSGALHKIQRTDPSIGGPEYSSDRPYIAILAELGLDKVGSGSSWPTRVSPRLDTDARCLRVNAYGFNTDTYPFLKGNEKIFETLEHLVRKQVIPQSDRPLALFLRDQVRYGSSAEVRHMNWERGSSATVGTVLGQQ